MPPRDIIALSIPSLPSALSVAYIIWMIKYFRFDCVFLHFSCIYHAVTHSVVAITCIIPYSTRILSIHRRALPHCTNFESVVISVMHKSEWMVVKIPNMDAGGMICGDPLIPFQARTSDGRPTQYNYRTLFEHSTGWTYALGNSWVSVGQLACL
jgi:hypothetical protein